MAEPPARSSGGRGQRSRLQRRAPASIKISPVSDWKAAIPLLSPLITSPPSLDLTVEIKSGTIIKHHPTEPEKPIVLKAWQHPAVPFCYEPPPPWMPFVCTGTLDRT